MLGAPIPCIAFHFTNMLLVPSIPARIPLSEPTLDESDQRAVTAAIGSGWVGPVGPLLGDFEKKVASRAGRRYAVALSSGTAALHLALQSLNVGPGDVVIVPTLTFAATAFAATYTGAEVVFVDVDSHTWTLEPHLLELAIKDLRKKNTPIGAVIPVDLYGYTCDYSTLAEVCGRYDIPLVVDAAEALGATYGELPAGAIGAAAIYSFNGNKIVTSGVGGALVTDDPGIDEQVRYLSTQAREKTPWYEHLSVGYNYRMSSLQAALGGSQLDRLDEIVAARRLITNNYRRLFHDSEYIRARPEPPWGRTNGWLTTVLIETAHCGCSVPDIRAHLFAADIEVRQIWKPLHQQPVFQGNRRWTSGISDALFHRGLCLPSSTGLSESDLYRVYEELTRCVQN